MCAILQLIKYYVPGITTEKTKNEPSSSSLRVMHDIHWEHVYAISEFRPYLNIYIL